jgi:iron complex transport system substrate-binding protein
MKTWRKTLGILLALILTLSALPALAQSDGYEPVTIETYNYAHEKVEYTFTKAPERVLVAYQNNLEIMLKLGLADRIVLAFGLDGAIAEDLKDEFAKITYQQERPSKEDVVALNPDFILGWYSVFAEDRFGDVGFWHERGVGTYMALNSSAMGKAAEFPRMIDYEMQDILTIGRIFHVEDAAQALVDEKTAEIDKVQAYVKESGVEPLSVAVLEDESDSYRVYGATTLGGDIALKVGAKLAVGAESSENIGAEDLIAADPDIILMVWYEGFVTPEQAVASIVDKPEFASLKAVKNGNVHALNLSEIYCSGLRTLDGIKTFAKALYPSLYQ